MKHILMIEEDEKMAKQLSLHLRDIQCEMEHVVKGAEGISLALTRPYDLIILAQVLPDAKGTDICCKLRQQGIRTPLMLLAAQPVDPEQMEESGVEDCLAKPFSIAEFTARVKAILRRMEQPQETSGEQIERGALSMDPVLKKVTLGGQPIELTFKEFELLHLFMANPGRSYTRAQLLSEVWGHAFSGFEHVVNSHINRLRSKIEKDTAHPEYILTTWGVGFRFTDEY